MRFQKAIKRMIALGTGAIMVGSSAFAAVDLMNLPAPFVKDGKFNAILMIGDKATAEDVIGVSDIIASMQAAATTKVSEHGGAEVQAEGDAWKVGTSTKILEMSENLNSGTNRESIATITTQSFIDDSEMPGLLAPGKVSNSKGQAEYDQRLYFEDTASGYVIYTENSDKDVTADFLFFPNGRQIARYEMEFTTQLESDVDDSSGSASTTGTFLTDFEDVDLNMMGKNFQIVTARRITTGGSNVVLTLMGGSTKDTMLEGATKTFTIDGKDYEVTLTYVDSDEAQFVVNGQTTRKLKDGDTDKLSDGTTIGVSEILYQDYAGGIHSATFFLGAQKVEVRDTNISDTKSSHELKIDDETIDNAHVMVEGTDDSTTFRLEKIIVNVTADDDFWVPAKGKLSEAMKESGAEPEALFTKNWDIEYLGLSMNAMSDINIKASGSDDYNLEFNDGSGKKVKLPLVHAVGSGSSVRTGDSDNNLVIQEGVRIAKDDYLVITDESDTDGERQTFALRYRGSDRVTKENPILKFDNLGSGERIERPITVGTGFDLATAVSTAAAFNHTAQLGEIKVGGGTFRVYNASSLGVDDYDVLVDLDADGSLTTQIVSLNTKEGARIDLVNKTSSMGFNISTVNPDDYDDLQGNPIGGTLFGSSGEVRMALNQTALNFLSPQGDDDNSYAYTSQGAFARLFAPSSDPQELYVQYPNGQRVPQVFITGKSASFSSSGGGGGGSGPVMVNPIQVGAAKLASEVADVKAQNSIVVGGPCANPGAAMLMGNPVDCTEGFTPGVGMIQVWEHANGNVAMLVAGYSGLDTRNAAQVVANYKDYKSQLKGMKVEVKKVNNQLTVAAPAPKVMAPAAPTTPENTATV